MQFTQIIDEKEYVFNAVGEFITGPEGPPGPSGPGVAIGGTAGQVLSKIDATDFNTQWVDPSAFGLGLEQRVTDLENNKIGINDVIDGGITM